jgi:hypothetical protein
MVNIKNPFADKLPRKLKEFVEWEDKRVKETLEKMTPAQRKKQKAAQKHMGDKAASSLL